MKEPKYVPVDPKAPYNGHKTYYHTNAGSWFADVEYPNPAKTVKPADLAKMQRRQERQPKRVIRFRKMRPAEKKILKWLTLLFLLKSLIFGL